MHYTMYIINKGAIINTADNGNFDRFLVQWSISHDNYGRWWLWLWLLVEGYQFLSFSLFRKWSMGNWSVKRGGVWFEFLFQCGLLKIRLMVAKLIHLFFHRLFTHSLYEIAIIFYFVCVCACVRKNVLKIISK